MPEPASAAVLSVALLAPPLRAAAVARDLIESPNAWNEIRKLPQVCIALVAALGASAARADSTVNISWQGRDLTGPTHCF